MEVSDILHISPALPPVPSGYENRFRHGGEEKNPDPHAKRNSHSAVAKSLSWRIYL
jgi:hypothetical protein